MFDSKVAILSRAILPRQMSVEELGEIMELRKAGAGDTDSKYQFVDVREEDELEKAKVSGKPQIVGRRRKRGEVFVRPEASRYYICVIAEGESWV